ncbi:MAG: right-handed parallel beta-helix repeat-containing protein [Planctomycetota bacterium]|nr:right-handed parallel beta-helix repeat-containing protein [Planctomycetota bacterium]
MSYRTGTILMKLTLACGALLTASWPSSAATYHVDFAGGQDANDGTTKETPWKHAPGDKAATDKPAGAKLAAGDVVRFKGGVIYRGSVVAQTSGTAEKPITYDGNSDGQWGEGRAVLQGCEPLTGWTQCQSAEECGGNPHWKDLWWAWAPKGTASGTANLFEDGQMLFLAQDPKQPDPFFMDKIKYFYTIPCKDMTDTSVVDPAHLNQKDEHYWDDAWVIVWAGPNAVYYRKIASFIPAENKITFAKLPAPPYTDRPEHYTIYNSLHLLSVPGEYYFDNRPAADGRHKVYLWPKKPGDLNRQEITISVRSAGLTIAEGVGGIVIAGFRIERYSGAGLSDGVGICILSWHHKNENIVVRNNSIGHIRSAELSYGGIYANAADNLLIENNEIAENPSNMGMLVGPRRVVVRNNTVRKCGGQGIWFMGCQDSQIVGNTVLDGTGTHANGISVYMGSKNILVLGNRVTNSNIAFTSSESDNVTVAYNVFHTEAFYAFANWNKNTDMKVYNNVILRGGEDLTAYTQAAGTTVTLKNNIITDNAGKMDENHNLRVVAADLAKIFAGPTELDFHLKPGSPAIDAGVDVGLDKDIAGTKVPQGNAPDIGAYEFVPR